LNWLLCRVRYSSLVLVFYMWMSSFPNTIVEEAAFSPTYREPLYKKKSDDYSCVGLFLNFLFYWSTSLFVPVLFCFVISAIWYNLKSDIMIPWTLLFLLRIALDVQRLLCFHMNFRFDFSISVKNDIGIFMMALNM
jgi:hypothetical protein